MGNLRAVAVAVAAACLCAAVPAATAAAPPAPQRLAGPVRITPPEESFFMEPHLLVKDDGLLVAAIEKSKPAQNEPVEIDRDGWTCRSDDGAAWSCDELTPTPGTTDFADPWLTDSRGEACDTYDGDTLVALEGGFGFRRYLEPIALATKDGGRTWSEPEQIPSNDPVADGTKTIFTGRLYAAWRDFAFAGGGRLSRLGTAADECRWSQPTVVGDGHDHPRLAEGTREDSVAYRGSAGATALTYTEYGDQPEGDQPEGEEEILEELGREVGAEEAAGEKSDHVLAPLAPPSLVATTTPLFLLTQLCDSADTHCFAAYDLGQTLVKAEDRRYHAVWLDRPAADPRDRRFTVVRMATSEDGGSTWSRPEVVAGPGARGSADESAAWMPALAFDESTRALALAYVERDHPDDREATMRVRVMRGGKWSKPADAGTTLTWTSTGTEKHLGDYFGLQARAGEIHVAFQNVTDEAGLARLEYTRLRERPLGKETRK